MLVIVNVALSEFADNPSTIVAKRLILSDEILMAPLLETEELKELLLELDELLETDDEELEMPELEEVLWKRMTKSWNEEAGNG